MSSGEALSCESSALEASDVSGPATPDEAGDDEQHEHESEEYERGGVRALLRHELREAEEPEDVQRERVHLALERIAVESRVPERGDDQRCGLADDARDAEDHGGEKSGARRRQDDLPHGCPF